MTEFDPAKFEDKYDHYFTDLQRAYRRAFDEMNAEYDSDLIHAIDQLILAESEPFYQGDGEFRIDLPDDPLARLRGAVSVDDSDAEAVLEAYQSELETQLQSVFEFETAE